jgi:hypothetical protein
MSIWYDEKGKFFTEVVSKETVMVIIQTPTNRIHGRIHVRPDQRLKDEINQSELFVAITDATIFDQKGKELFSSNFIALNREQIVWIFPEDQLLSESQVNTGKE